MNNFLECRPHRVATGACRLPSYKLANKKPGGLITSHYNETINALGAYNHKNTANN